MKLWLSILSVLIEYAFTARTRIQCIRHGHRFLCTPDGHVCRKCGRFWGFYD